MRRTSATRCSGYSAAPTRAYLSAMCRPLTKHLTKQASITRSSLTRELRTVSLIEGPPISPRLLLTPGSVYWGSSRLILQSSPLNKLRRLAGFFSMSSNGDGTNAKGHRIDRYDYILGNGKAHMHTHAAKATLPAITNRWNIS